MDESNPLWTTEQTADFLGFPKSSLEKWRRIRTLRMDIVALEALGEKEAIPDLNDAIERIHGPKLSGPPFVRLGERKVRYRKDDVLRWAKDPI